MQAETPESLPEPRPRRRIPRPVLIAALAGTGVLIALAATRPLGGEPLPSFFAVGSAVPGLALGAIAPGTAPDPDAAQYTLVATDGTPIALSDYAGHPLWLVFWKADCPPCEAEAADVQAAYAAHHGDGLVVIGIDVWDSAAAASDYLADHPTPYPVAVDPSGAFEILGLAEGRYQVEAFRARRDEDEDRPWISTYLDHVEPGGEPLFLVLERGTTIEGVLRDARGEPAAGLYVQPRIDDVAPRVAGGMTDGGGRFRLVVPRNTRWTIDVWGEGDEVLLSEPGIAAGTRELELELPAR